LKEQLIEFKTAKLAKEKGFDVECNSYYIETLEHELYIPREGLTTFPAHKPRVLTFNPLEPYHINHGYAPTQSLLQKWLRDVHGIDVYCVPTIHPQEGEPTYWHHNFINDGLKEALIGTYEDILERGLQRALKLIP
jgi:hypothetical protein